MGNRLHCFLIFLLAGDLACRGPTRANRGNARAVVGSAAPLASSWRSEPGGAPEREPAEVADSAPIAAHSRPASLLMGYARPVRQTLACGVLGFVRLTEPGFEAYDYRTLTRTMRRGEGAFTHVVAQPGYSYLLVGGGPSLLYYQANPRLTPLGHLPALGPLWSWADAQQRDRVWVHYLKDDAVHHFELSRNVKRPAELLNTVSLPGFDGNRVVRLVGGQWVYTAHNEFAAAPRLRLVDGLRQVWLGTALSAEVFVPGGGMNLWAIDAGRTTRYEITPLDQVLPAMGLPLVGEVWAAVSEGERLALLGQSSSEGHRQWGVQVVANGRSFHVRLPDLTDRSAPELAKHLTLCLAPARTWVVLGDRRDVRVVDYVAGTTVWRSH